MSTAIREGGAIGKILQILSSITQQQPQDDNIQKSALRAIQSWLHFDVSDDPNMLGILPVCCLLFFYHLDTNFL